MQYIIFDLEFNQDFSTINDTVLNVYPNNTNKNNERLSKEFIIQNRYPFEIIQIGAIKLDENFQNIATFNRFVKPTIYSKVSTFITELTGITTEQLILEEDFPRVYYDFLDFIGNSDSILCIWGMSDVKELFKNAEYHQLSRKPIPRKYINIQPFVSKHFLLPKNTLIRLQHAVEFLDINQTYHFHNALNDAYYTAEVFKKIYSSSIEPKIYNPSYIVTKPRTPKKEIDYDRLLQQFKKMYDREMTEDEEEMIKLAYKMGKTNQFVKLAKNSVNSNKASVKSGD
jgi:inhibitor of KinA sporulation pathway (predicted exonuclease)